MLISLFLTVPGGDPTRSTKSYMGVLASRKQLTRSCGARTGPSLLLNCYNYFYSGASMDFMGSLVSQNLHFYAVKRVLYAPMSFFDTTVSLAMYATLGGH